MRLNETTTLWLVNSFHKDPDQGLVQRFFHARGVKKPHWACFGLLSGFFYPKNPILCLALRML